MRRYFTPETKKVVFFDLNQTLFDPQKTFDQAFVDVVNDYVGRWEPDDGTGPEQILDTYREEWRKRNRASGGKTVRKKANRAGKNPTGGKSAGRQELEQACLSAALHGLPAGRADLPKRLLAMIKARRQREPRLYPGAREALEQLAGRYRLAVISSGGREKRIAQLERLGLLGLLPADRVFGSLPAGKRKPHPDVFAYALKAMAVTGPQAVMVGDSWPLDIMGAVKAGMDAVWIRPVHGKKSSLRKLGSRKILIIRSIDQLAARF